MSTIRGSNVRTRPQKHQNRTAFKNNLHDTSHKTKFINSLEVTGVCNRCKDIIEWKIKYKKYKPLTAARKCVGCEQKTVKYAYHMMCTKCAKDKQICAKCYKSIADANMEFAAGGSEKTDLKALLKDLPERKRRTILRHLNKKGQGQEKITPEIKAEVEEMISKMENVDLDDELFFSDDSLSESNEQSI